MKHEPLMTLPSDDAPWWATVDEYQRQLNGLLRARNWDAAERLAMEFFERAPAMLMRQQCIRARAPRFSCTLAGRTPRWRPTRWLSVLCRLNPISKSTLRSALSSSVGRLRACQSLRKRRRQWSRALGSVYWGTGRSLCLPLAAMARPSNVSARSQASNAWRTCDAGTTSG